MINEQELCRLQKMQRDLGNLYIAVRTGVKSPNDLCNAIASIQSELSDYTFDAIWKNKEDKQ